MLMMMIMMMIMIKTTDVMDMIKGVTVMMVRCCTVGAGVFFETQQQVAQSHEHQGRTIRQH
jgi:LytS/YehU family sensor histidine kinase